MQEWDAGGKIADQALNLQVMKDLIQFSSVGV